MSKVAFDKKFEYQVVFQFSTMKTEEVDQNLVPEEKSKEEESLKLFNLESKFEIPYHI